MKAMQLSKEEYLESKKIFDEEGYIVFQNVLNKGEIEAYFRALDPYLTKDVNCLLYTSPSPRDS